MTLPAIVCRELHLLHLRVRDLRADADRGPNQLRKYEIRIADQEKQLQALHDKIKHAKATIHQKELDIKDNNDKVEKHRKQMSLVTNTKEYNALRSEIDHEQQATRVVEDQILEAMLALDELSKQAPDLDKSLKAAKDEQAKAQAALGGQAQELAQSLADAEAALQAAEAGLSAELKSVYDRLVKAHGADSLSPVDGRSCAACYTEVTPQGYNDLRAGRLGLCKNCGKLLYLAE